MPATHRIEVHKSLGAEEWCNTYLMECASFTEALTFGDLLVTFERNLHRDNVVFNYFLASTLTVGDRVFRHVAVNLPGLIAFGSQSYLPLWNTLRVDFSTSNSDPCRKYYRLPIIEAMQTNGTFEPAEVTNFNTIINTHFFTTVMGDNLYSSTGHQVVSGTAHPQLQMRQLHRRRRRNPITGTPL